MLEPSPEDTPHILALLMLIVLDDLFNPEIFALGRDDSDRLRKPVRALYTVSMKGLAWEIIDYLSETYKWTSVNHEPLSFTSTFEQMVGRQLRCIKEHRTQFVEKTRYQQGDAAAEEFQSQWTATLGGEIEMLINQKEEIKAGFLATEGGTSADASLRYITTLLDPHWKMSSWIASLSGEEFTPKSHEDRLEAARCERDSQELKGLDGIDAPETFDIYSEQ